MTSRQCSNTFCCGTVNRALYSRQAFHADRADMHMWSSRLYVTAAWWRCCSRVLVPHVLLLVLLVWAVRALQPPQFDAAVVAARCEQHRGRRRMEAHAVDVALVSTLGMQRDAEVSRGGRRQLRRGRLLGE